MTAEFPKINATVDVVIFSLKGDELCVALQRRDKAPYKNELAFPGGYVHAQEDADTLASAHRILSEKVGLKASHLEQLFTFSGLERDPRGFSLSVTYLALLTAQEAEQPNVNLTWMRTQEARSLKLAFDHNHILETALERLRSKALYPEFLTGFWADTFSIPQLQQTYEILTGEPIDRHTFRRRLDALDMLEPVQGQKYQAPGKAAPPAKVFRLKNPQR